METVPRTRTEAATKLIQQGLGLDIDPKHQQGLLSQIMAFHQDLETRGIVAPITRGQLRGKYKIWDDFPKAEEWGMISPTEETRGRGKETTYTPEELIAYRVLKNWLTQNEQPDYLKGKIRSKNSFFIPFTYIDYVRELALYLQFSPEARINTYFDLLENSN